MRKAIKTDNAPGAVGPYSQGMETDNLVFVSGQLPLVPGETDLLTDIKEATNQCFKNVEAILKEAGTDLNNAVKIVVFLEDMDDFAEMNEVYATFFDGDCPARSAFEVASLPMGAIVEVEAIAVK